MGVRGVAPTLAGAFEQAAMALTAVMLDPAEVACLEQVDIECQAPDVELLLADWLNALIYHMATRRMLFARFEVSLNGAHLQGRAWGEAVDLQRHQPAVEIKGATYTELKVFQNEAGWWVAQCVVDV